MVINLFQNTNHVQKPAINIANTKETFTDELSWKSDSKKQEIKS